MAAATLGLVPTIAVATLNTTAHAVGGAVATTRDFAGFPHWYEDNNGTRVDACLDLTDTHCVLLATPTFNPGAPLSFPNNFPDEFFYSVVDSDKLTTPGCVGDPDPTAAAPGLMVIRMALEGAFGTGNATPGNQMTFGRIRVTVKGGLCSNQTYTFKTPYGDFPFTTDANGGIKPAAGTMQAGCPIPTPTSPCDYTAALSSPLITAGLLRWDTGADPGYLGGDPTVLHTITGGVNGNSVSVLDNTGAAVAGLTSNVFTVSGRLAGPLLADTPLLDLGAADITVPQTTTNTITLTNVSRDAGATSALVFGAPTITGTDAADFAVTGTNCANLGGLDSSCSVTVSFTPTLGGRRNATLNVPYGGGQHAPFTVPLAGTGVTSGAAPIITLSTPALAFGNARVGTLTPFQSVTITNGGTSPLQVQSIQSTGTNASEFRTGQDQCTTTGPGLFIQPGNTCTFGVAFQPTTVGAKTAAMQINANIAGAPTTLTLTATGTGGVARMSSTPNGGIDPSNGFPYWYQDEANQRTGACIDPQDSLCVVLADSFYDPAQPMVFPTNFPSEFFYTVATSDNIATPGCGNSAPGKAFIRTAVEGAFGGPTGGPVPGDQITFARTRIVVTSGLCANTPYVFTYPYGQITLTTDAAGGIRRNAATNNAGCGAGGVGPCDFTLALQGETFGEFVKQVNAPAGYLGDPNLLAPIQGAPFIDPSDNVTPANFLRIDGPDGNGAAQSLLTDQFTVMGKLVGPVVANPSPVLFGGVDVLSGPTAPQSVTFTNDGNNNVTLGASPLAIGGATAADFALVPGSDCTAGLVLAPTQSCTANVTFNPQGSGPRLGTLSLISDAPNSPTPVNLEGTGNAAAGFPAISVRPLTVDFTDLHIGGVSASESVRPSNAGGSAPLKIGANAGAGPLQITTTNVPGLAGPVDPNFTLVDNCAADVAPDAACEILVKFTPQTPGLHTAYLHVTNNTTITPDVVVTLVGRGSTAVPLVAAADPVHGFPTYTGDTNGVRLQPCLTSGDANCVLLADAGYNPAQPVVFPTNFPLEFFYGLADSQIITVSKATNNCGVGGTVQLRLALEGTFTTTTVQAGAQTFFGRWRITGKSLCPNTSYTFDTPWGTQNLATNGAGAIPANQGTIDFTNPLVNAPGLSGGPLSTGFLRWDPQSATPPAGYLGDGRSFKPVIGAVYQLGGEPVNYFRITGNGTNDKTTDFLVSGKTAGPVVTSVTSLSFGNQAQGTSSAPKTITYTNLSNDPVSNIAVTTAAPFTVSNDLCTGTTLATQDSSCTVQVSLAPTIATPTGAVTGAVNITHDGLRPTPAVTVTGTVTQPATAEMHVTPPSVNFGSVAVGATTTTNITISSTGTADLTISNFGFTGPNAADYTVLAGGGSCPLLAPITVTAGTSCTMTLRFAPSAQGNRTATFSVTSSNAPVNPTQSVSLVGTGLAAQATVSPTTLSFATKGTSTGVVKITNTGTANLNLLNPVFTVNAVAPATSAMYPATHNCNNVAPGKSCNVSITFTPGAGTSPQTLNATLLIKTNATNSSAGQPVGVFAITLNGQRK